ncbi:MAG TPA: TraB/GumN family protein [Allosphingosinicella sp.]|uniref:TraB/GumN family protein n=1 Tax=Allosphingosinicella sp. TaxID=2823234 RepID=UPI002EDB58F4
MIWTKLRNAVAAVAALGAAACTTVPQPRSAAAAGTGPALWKVSDADTTIYLFGTFHMLPEGTQWRTPALEQAIAASDELVIETLIGDQMAAARTMAQIGTSPGLPPILERVPADRRDDLEWVIKASGAPMAALDRLETWAAAMALSGATFRSLGLNPELGVEKGLEGTYKQRSRPVLGLETVEEQLGYFDRLSEDAQRKFLMGVLDDPEEVRRQFAEMLRTWSTGDVEGIARTFDADLKESPELRDALLLRRNRNWAEWIDERLDRPGTTLVAVGAGHLAGNESVQRMLEGRGIRVVRVQ